MDRLRADIPNRSNSTPEGGLSESDLTPKPLRIVKRISTTDSSHSSTCSNLLPNSIFSMGKSTQRTRQDSASTRPSSVSTDHSLSDLSIRDPGKLTLPRPHRDAHLNVRKRRRVDADNMRQVAGSVSAIVPNQFFSPPTIHTAMEEQAEGSQRNGATTLRRFSKASFLSAINDNPPVPPARKPLVGAHRRAVTANEELQKYANEWGIGIRDLPRQRSFGHRLFSRIVSGLTQKTTSMFISPAQEHLTSHPHLPKGPDNLETCEASDMVRRSASNSSSDTVSGKDLDHALAVFPSPPTSASYETVGFVEALTSSSPGFRELSRPEYATMVCAELNITPEKEHLNSESKTSMFVAIDIRASVAPKPDGSDDSSHDNSLDVAIVIDNSLFTSPTTLMASCETARFLASILDPETDKVAILCTSTIHEHTPAPAIISHLESIKMPKLKVALDCITSSHTIPSADALECALRCAQDLLMRAPKAQSSNQTMRNTFGHIVILTADTNGLSNLSLAHEKLQTHIIYPGSVPRGIDDCLRSNGWKLRSLEGSAPQAVSSKKDDDPNSFFNSIRELIRNARRGHLTGSLRDLVLDISAGPESSIEGIMGTSYFRRLQCGEIKTVLVNVRVLLPEVKQRPKSRRSLSRSRPTTHELVGELEQMLGASVTTVLTARLRYKHSSLPVNTTCSATAHCELRRHTPRMISRNTEIAQNVVPQVNAKQNVLVHQRLANYIAISCKPSDALAALRSEFGRGAYCSDCPEYLALLDKELRFQCRIIDRLAILESPQKVPKHFDDHRLDDAYDNFAHVVGVVDDRPLTWIAGLSGRDPSATEEMHVDALSDLKNYQQKEHAQPDEARKIWEDLKRMSKGTFSVGRGREVSPQVDDENTRFIRELAIRNKRSIGDDTLRSFTAPALRTELGAPWL